MIRPITLAPFPTEAIRELSKRVRRILVVEMNTGQMLNDVKQAVGGNVPIEFYGRIGGITPLPDEILEEIHRVNQNTGDMADGQEKVEWIERLEARIERGDQ